MLEGTMQGLGKASWGLLSLEEWQDLIYVSKVPFGCPWRTQCKGSEWKWRVKSYSRGSGWEFMMTWTKVVKRGMAQSKAKLGGRKEILQELVKQSSFPLQNLAIMCCWRKQLWLGCGNWLLDSFIHSFTNIYWYLLCGKHFSDSSFRERYQGGSKI